VAEIPKLLAATWQEKPGVGRTGEMPELLEQRGRDTEVGRSNVAKI
jgi:hypothetical protein